MQPSTPSKPHRWAIVLGGSSGLGLASARRLAAQGYKLCLVYRERRANQHRVLAAVQELAQQSPHVLHFNTDALSETGRTAILDALEGALHPGERVDVLLHSLAKAALRPISSQTRPPRVWPERTEAAAALRQGYEATDQAAGKTPTQRAAELSSRDVHLTIEAMGTSLLDWVNDIRARQLLAADTRVLALTSEGARRAWRGYASVSAAKSTLEALVRSIALELGPFGVRANCVQAGVTDTPALRHIPNHEQLLVHAVARNPMGRLTRPEDVADVVAMLCRPEAAWINGTVVIADGGEHLC